MVELFNSLTLWSGSLAVAVLCLIAGSFSYQLLKSVQCLARGVTVALMSSYTIYWAPTWLGGGSVELRNWELLFVGPWFVAGLLAFYSAAYLTRIFISKRKGR